MYGYLEAPYFYSQSCSVIDKQLLECTERCDRIPMILDNSGWYEHSFLM